MDLILWRHADAEMGYPDAARRLTAKGEKQARRMAAWLKQHLPADTKILVSPAVRAQQTALALTDRFVTDDAVGLEARAGGLLAAVGWPHGSATVLVVGHQPTLGEVAAYALTGMPASWSVKKGSVWWLQAREGEVLLRAVMPPDLV